MFQLPEYYMATLSPLCCEWKAHKKKYLTSRLPLYSAENISNASLCLKTHQAFELFHNSQSTPAGRPSALAANHNWLS